MGRLHSSHSTLIERIQKIEKDVQILKREVLKHHQPDRQHSKHSLFGSVKGGDITPKVIEESKKSLFRNLKDIK